MRRRLSGWLAGWLHVNHGRASRRIRDAAISICAPPPSRGPVAAALCGRRRCARALCPQLAQKHLRGVVDPSLKPNTAEREAIEALIAHPRDELTAGQKDLLWRLRYSLTDNKKALTKFLFCVDWDSESEVRLAAVTAALPACLSSSP
jgi:hypothetical protein